MPSRSSESCTSTDLRRYLMISTYPKLQDSCPGCRRTFVPGCAGRGDGRRRSRGSVLDTADITGCAPPSSTVSCHRGQRVVCASVSASAFAAGPRPRRTVSPFLSRAHRRGSVAAAPRKASPCVPLAPVPSPSRPWPPSAWPPVGRTPCPPPRPRRRARPPRAGARPLRPPRPRTRRWRRRCPPRSRRPASWWWGSTRRTSRTSSSPMTARPCLSLIHI